MKILLENRWQALKVRILLWGSVAGCIGALYGAWSLYETYGLNPGDGGVLRPLEERVMAAAIVASLGLAFVGAMLFFASRYAVRIEREGDRVDLVTMSLIGTKVRQYSTADFGGGNYHHGRMVSGRGHSVNAPWITLRVKDKRVPFMVDLQAERIDRAALRKLAKGAVNKWQADEAERAI